MLLCRRASSLLGDSESEFHNDIMSWTSNSHYFVLDIYICNFIRYTAHVTATFYSVTLNYKTLTFISRHCRDISSLRDDADNEVRSTVPLGVVIGW
jgi:hypothetical protein